LQTGEASRANSAALNGIGAHDNFIPSFLEKFSWNALGGPPSGTTVLDYCYAAMHSPTYRIRYAPLLKADFPRIPLPRSQELFIQAAALGRELVSLHLLESPALNKHRTKFVGKNAEVEKASWSDDTVWIDKGKTAGFKGVPQQVWEFHIGGYQVCEKWLKDRKGRTLSKDDIEHYHKIVVALSETIRLMGEIDAVIDQHGGWPGAFVAKPAEAEA
jgi:predicted helicase